jgi:hypothetical protein
MLHTESVSVDLLNVVKQLCALSALDSFKLVGGTAIALHLGHRKSIDIDLFSNEKLNRDLVRKTLHAEFPNATFFVDEHSLVSEINGVRVELYDEWHIPFQTPIIFSDGIRLASLDDLTAFKLSAITGRREKKDYIDLYFLFDKIGAMQALTSFKNYEPHMSMKSVLFALGEIGVTRTNQSPTPKMILPLDWDEVEQKFEQVAKEYLTLMGHLKQ